MMKQIRDRDRPEYELPFESAGKRPRKLATSEAEDEDEDEDEEEMFLAELSVEEETLMQVMKVLEEEISCPNNGVTDFNLSSSVMYYPPSSSFVTINGNEESCGPSFSDSSSTVMASIDMGGINISYFMGSSDGFPFFGGALDLPAAMEEEQGWAEMGEVEVSVSASLEEVMMNKGCESEVGESEDEWLDRVLSEAPFEFVE